LKPPVIVQKIPIRQTTKRAVFCVPKTEPRLPGVQASQTVYVVLVTRETISFVWLACLANTNPHLDLQLALFVVLDDFHPLSGHFQPIRVLNVLQGRTRRVTDRSVFCVLLHTLLLGATAWRTVRVMLAGREAMACVWLVCLENTNPRPDPQRALFVVLDDFHPLSGHFPTTLVLNVLQGRTRRVTDRSVLCVLHRTLLPAVTALMIARVMLVGRDRTVIVLAACLANTKQSRGPTRVGIVPLENFL